MAHFAELNSDNMVLRVVVIADQDCQDDNGNESEAVGIAFCKQLFGSETNWVQTSYNSSIRQNYAHVGGEYMPDLDVFVAPQPYESWTLNQTSYIWEPPLDYPDDSDLAEGLGYVWDEALYQSDNTQGWVIEPLD